MLYYMVNIYLYDIIYDKYVLYNLIICYKFHYKYDYSKYNISLNNNVIYNEKLIHIIYHIYMYFLLYLYIEFLFYFFYINKTFLLIFYIDSHLLYDI